MVFIYGVLVLSLKFVSLNILFSVLKKKKKHHLIVKILDSIDQITVTYNFIKV